MKSCPTQKRSYDSAVQAEQALLEMQGRLHFRPGEGPVGVYQCDICRGYHLTSKGPVNASLASHLKEGSIALQREANYWLGKLKGGR